MCRGELRSPELKLIAAGASAEVYEYDSDKVLKLFINPADKGNAKWEYDKTKNACNNGLPTPCVYDFVEVDGRYGFVMEKVSGSSFAELMRASIFASEANGVSLEQAFHSDILPLVKQTAQLLCELHQTKCELMDTAAATFSRHISYSGDLSEGEKSALYAIAHSLPYDNTVCHGDANSANVIQTAHGNRLIDWCDCCSGSPYFDLAAYAFSWEYAVMPQGMPPIITEFISQFKDTIVTEFLREYAAISQLDLSPFPQWYAVFVASRLFNEKHEENKIKQLSQVCRLLNG